MCSVKCSDTERLDCAQKPGFMKWPYHYSHNQISDRIQAFKKKYKGHDSFQAPNSYFLFYCSKKYLASPTQAAQVSIAAAKVLEKLSNLALEPGPGPSFCTPLLLQAPPYLNWCSLELRILEENRSASFSRLLEYSSSISAFLRKNSCRSCSSCRRDSDCCSRHLNCSTS